MENAIPHRTVMLQNIHTVGQMVDVVTPHNVSRIQNIHTVGQMVDVVTPHNVNLGITVGQMVDVVTSHNAMVQNIHMVTLMARVGIYQNAQ